MTALCKCKKFKTISPFHASGTVRWMCEECKRASINLKRKAAEITKDKRRKLRRAMTASSTLICDG